MREIWSKALVPGIKLFPTERIKWEPWGITEVETVGRRYRPLWLRKQRKLRDKLREGSPGPKTEASEEAARLRWCRPLWARRRGPRPLRRGGCLCWGALTKAVLQVMGKLQAGFSCCFRNELPLLLQRRVAGGEVAGTGKGKSTGGGSPFFLPWNWSLIYCPLLTELLMETAGKAVGFAVSQCLYHKAGCRRVNLELRDNTFIPDTTTNKKKVLPRKLRFLRCHEKNCTC